MTNTGPRLRVGYVGVAFPSFYATELNEYSKAIAGLGGLADRLDFDLVAFEGPVSDIAEAESAATELKAQ
ncbi:MAG: hypothetical protein GY720_19735, partial [bacterium]|nr:hypothetical protein [bacterium]